MEQEIVEFWADARNEIVGKCIQLSVKDSALGSDEWRQGNRERVFDSLWSVLLQDMQDDTLAKTEEVIGSLAREAVKYGRDVEPLERIIEILMESAEETARSKYPEEPDRLSRITGDVKEYLNKAMTVLARSIIKAQAEVIEKQKDYLLELSTPAIPLLDGILILPLIGTIDTRRAKQIMDNLLNGIVEAQADTVLIDISGVPIVDTQVAHHLMKTVQAARLLGARCIIVGIRPEFAQTIVKLGIDFGKIVTKNSLQAGLKLAFEWHNYELRRVGGGGHHAATGANS
jgi:rsbT co-antagonist protein RsbR